MCQNSVDDILFFNTPVRRIGNDSHRTTAAAADLDVDAEHTFQALSPGHRGMVLGR
jgi:hypothetical protein